jgi:hypothetical protein
VATGRPSAGEGGRGEEEERRWAAAAATAERRFLIFISFFFSQISYSRFECNLNSNLNINACNVYHRMFNKQGNTYDKST